MAVSATTCSGYPVRAPHAAGRFHCCWVVIHSLEWQSERDSDYGTSVSNQITMGGHISQGYPLLPSQINRVLPSQPIEKNAGTGASDGMPLRRHGDQCDETRRKDAIGERGVWIWVAGGASIRMGTVEEPTTSASGWHQRRIMCAGAGKRLALSAPATGAKRTAIGHHAGGLSDRRVDCLADHSAPAHAAADDRARGHPEESSRAAAGRAEAPAAADSAPTTNGHAVPFADSNCGEHVDTDRREHADVVTHSHKYVDGSRNSHPDHVADLGHRDERRFCSARRDSHLHTLRPIQRQ